MNRDTLRNLWIASLIFLVVMWVGPRLLPTPPPPPVTPASPSSVPGESPFVPPDPSTPTVPGERTTAARPALEAGGPAPLEVVEADSVQTLFMGAEPEDSAEKKVPAGPFRMGLTLSNLGASVESATIADHAETLHSPERYLLLGPVVSVDGISFRSLAVENINIDGIDVPVRDRRWHAEPVQAAERTRPGGVKEVGQSVVFRLDIHRDGQPLVRLTRNYFLPQQPPKGGRHDLHTDLQVTNLSTAPHRVVVTYQGGMGVRQASPRWDDRIVDMGLRYGGRVEGHRHTHQSVLGAAAHALNLYVAPAVDDGTRLSWAATANTFFTCTVAPLAPDGQGQPADLAKVEAFDADGSPTTGEDLTLRFVSRAQELAAGATASYPADVFLGEKEVDAFRQVPVYRDRNYYFQISAGYGWCTFSWLVEMMIWLLNKLHLVVRDFGVAIIILVLIVRTILHPITKKGQVNMVRMQHQMQELAPKIEEIKKKYANDKPRMNQEMMKLNINPAGQMLTCLPMILQMPIWVALYISLSNNILMRHEGFLFTWIHDLTAPDAAYVFASPFYVPLFGWEIASLNILPFLLALAMYLQQKTQPKPKPHPNMTEQQRQQQEMMQRMGPIMSIMMFLIFYNMPAGLNLYIMASSFFGMIEQSRIRKHIREQEEAGTLMKPARKTAPVDALGRPQKAGGPGWFDKLQKMAEEAQKVQSQRQAKGKPKR